MQSDEELGYNNLSVIKATTKGKKAESLKQK